MKNIFTAILFLLIVNIANCQFTKGTKQIGGVFKAISKKNTSNYTALWNSSLVSKTSQFTSISIIPKYGWFINDKTSVGLGLGYSYTSSTVKYDNSTVEDKEGSNTIHAQLFTRFHKNIAEKFYFFLQPELDLQFTNTKIKDNDDYENKSSGFNLGVSPGVVYFFSEKMSLDFSFGNIGYSNSITSISNKTISPKSDDKSSGFGIDLSSQSLKFGVLFYF